jgi:hypothetical protein
MLRADMTENEFIRSNGWFIASPAYFGMNVAMNKQGMKVLRLF